MDDAHQEVFVKLKNHRESLERLAGILLEQESVDGEELKKLAEEVRMEAATAEAQTSTEAAG